MNLITLCDQFCDYSSYIRGYSPATIRRYKQVINYYIGRTGDFTPDLVSEEHVRNLFYQGRTERNWSTNTYIQYHKTLVVFFRWCREQGHIEADPMKNIEVPKLEKRLPKKLTKQEALHILEVVDNYPYQNQFLRYRNSAIFTTFIFAGLRKNELLNLKYGDVDIENKTLFIRQGKGNKDRIIPMSNRLAESLSKYLLERKKLDKTCPEFFTSLIRNVGFTHSGLKRLVEKVNEVSRIRFTIHKLRHTFATLMLEGGCDIFSLSKMLGHADIKTTTIYLAATPEHLRSQMVKHPLNSI